MAITTGKSILVVDNDEEILRIYAQVYKNMGYEVMTADNGEQAEAIFANFPIDLVVTDNDLGSGMNGIVLARHLRMIESDIPTVLVSSNIIAHTLGDFSYAIEKPFTIKTIRDLTQLIT